jgi:hypothetical protein
MHFSTRPDRALSRRARHNNFHREIETMLGSTPHVISALKQPRNAMAMITCSGFPDLLPRTFGTIATRDYYSWNRLSEIRRFTQSRLTNHVSFDRHNRKTNFTYFAGLGLFSARHPLQLSTQGFGTLSE